MKTIEYKVSYEKMISRLPGLFAYLESDEFGNMSLHKATDSLDGCWGKIVENIKLPSDVALTIKKTHVITFEDVINEYIWLDSSEQKHVAQETDIDNEIEEYYFFLKSGEVYSFRTIIDYYYQYREELGEENSFVKFVEEGIGKIKVPDEIRNVATPKFLYLSNVKSFYNQLVKMKKMCDFYYNKINGISDWCNNEDIYTIEEKDKHLCCLCDKYCKMGGDAFKEYVGSLIPTAETIAKEYYDYANNGKTMTLDFDVDLTSTYQDFGIISPYVPIWIPGKRYFVGDKVQYDGDLYKCIIENNGEWSDDYLTVIFDDTKFEKIDSRFVDIHTEEQEGKIVYTKNYIEKTINSVGEIWYDGEGIKHIAQNEDIGREVLNYNIKLQSPLKIEGTTDSKLTDLRRFVTYYNDDNVAERPANGYDWLFYYRVGEVVNIKTVNNKLGNVVKLSDLENTNINSDDLESCEDKDYLAAYGDVIESINYLYTNGVSVITNEEYDDLNEEEKADFYLKYSIRFTYRVGVHLKATAAPTPVIDDDGNILYKWDKFIRDENEKIGIKYQETYNYEEGSDLDKLIKGEFTIEGVNETFTFNDYIDGMYDKKIPTYKFEFITYNNTYNYDKTIAHQDVNIVSILTDFETNRNSFEEYTQSDFYREDYFNGITYQPKKNIDVNIQRGSTSVFDKHISFGEIKSLEDMEMFKNNSFFKMNVS